MLDALDRRYLIPFKAPRLPQQFTDVLVIGGGVAGLRAAIAAAGEGADVLLLTKERSTSPIPGTPRVASPRSSSRWTATSHTSTTRKRAGPVCATTRRSTLSSARGRSASS